MSDNSMTQDCPQDLLAATVEILRSDDEQGLAQIDDLIADYGRDARLHFLKGSVLAGLRRYDEAHSAMRRAVEIAPGYTLARFQYGFLQLTSGDAASAEATWAPLHDLPDDDALKLFVRGLSHIARDEFALGIDLLNRGIAANSENPPINADMRLIIATAEASVVQGPAEDAGPEPLSPTQLFLQQRLSKTRH